MQTRCPSFHEYWVERDALNGIFEELDQEGFQRAQRETTRAERKAHPGSVILVKDGIETLLPGVDYVALKSIKYRAFVRSVLEANPARFITLAEMQLLWDATVHKVFRFECACAKESKANEVRIRTFRELIGLLILGRVWVLMALVKHNMISLSKT